MDQNQPILQPEIPQPPSLPSTGPKSKPPKWVWFVIGGAVVVIGLVIFIVIMLLRVSQPQTSNGQTGGLRVNGRPYIYPCSVATASDYARIFELDDSKIGTLTETSALAAKNIKNTEADLTKTSPPTSERYNSGCSHLLSSNEKGAELIDVKIAQYTSEEEAQKSYTLARDNDSSVITDQGLEEGKRQLNPLPSFSDNSYVRVPDDATSSTVEVNVLLGSYLIDIDYLFDPPRTAQQSTALIDEYMKAIKANIDKKQQSAPTDLTGRATGIGKKFVDVCHRTDYGKLAESLAAVEFRPDKVINTSTYGSLEGSSAAEDGVVSSCSLNYNTSADRQALDEVMAKAKEKSQESQFATGPIITSEATWPHKLVISTNSFANDEAAGAFLGAKKQRLNDAFDKQPTIQDVSGLGDAAFSLHTERELGSFSNDKAKNSSVEDAYVVRTGSDVITISLAQENNHRSFKTAPLEPKKDYFQKVYELIKSTMASNR